MKNTFDYQRYWVDRLKRANESLVGVGHKRFGTNANNLMYKKTEEVLEKVVKRLGIDLKNATVLDAGAGIGMFCGFYQKKGAKVTAIDISKDGLDILKKKYPDVQTKVVQLESSSGLGKQQFDIVHCFDVLYHITDDRMWKKTVENFAQSSKKYIIVHDKYPYFGHSFFETGHVKVRKGEEMKKILKKYGFKETGSFPTHLFYVRPILHLLIGIVPEPFYYLDRTLLYLKASFLQTSYIRVFKK